MALERAVINCRTKFWEYGQLYIALSRVKNRTDLCILLPPDTHDFFIRPRVDLNVVRILDTMRDQRQPPVPQISPEENIEPDLNSFDGSEPIS
jgi:hypothetical protein